MSNREKILSTIFATIEEMNLTLPEGDRIAPAESTALFGSGARLDSLGLVTLIVALEQNLARELGLEITLADEKAMSQRNSPFRTVQSLADYVEQLSQTAGA